MKNWRETGDNLQKELDRQSARREIEAEINYHKNITIDDVECERAIIGTDGEGMDGGPNTILERVENGVKVKWPDHYTILLGAGGVGFTKDGRVLDLLGTSKNTRLWYDDRRSWSHGQIVRSSASD